MCVYVHILMIYNHILVYIYHLDILCILGEEARLHWVLPIYYTSLYGSKHFDGLQTLVFVNCRKSINSHNIEKKKGKNKIMFFQGPLKK